jgi:hypothetical protein
MAAGKEHEEIKYLDSYQESLLTLLQQSMAGSAVARDETRKSDTTMLQKIEEHA